MVHSATNCGEGRGRCRDGESNRGAFANGYIPGFSHGVRGARDRAAADDAGRGGLVAAEGTAGVPGPGEEVGEGNGHPVRHRRGERYGAVVRARAALAAF